MFNCSITLFPRLVLIVPLKQSNDVTETKFPTFALYFMFQLVLNIFLMFDKDIQMLNIDHLF